MLQTNTAPRASASKRTGGSLDLDQLAARSFEDLEAMYRGAPEPTDLRGVDGRPRGRMLAVRSISNGVLGGAIRKFAGSRSFVWDGKTFSSHDALHGEGINRVQVPGVLGRQQLFPFATRIEASAIDGRKAIVLDYDLDQNPGMIRRIHDEIREVEPGLYLGPAMWKGASGKVTVLWFALDTRSPSTWS
jgi:hypothetical protein